jgi:hypothetical protein
LLGSSRAAAAGCPASQDKVFGGAQVHLSQLEQPLSPLFKKLKELHHQDGHPPPILPVETLHTHAPEAGVVDIMLVSIPDVDCARQLFCRGQG